MQKKIVLLLVFCMLAAVYCASQDTSGVDTCLNCHKDKSGQAKKFVHPLIKQGKCSACHNSYDITTHRQGHRPAIEPCTGCHSMEKLGRSHPVGGGIIDPNTGGEMTCVSTCHLPHGAGYKYELPFKDSMELCLSCHKDF